MQTYFKTMEVHWQMAAVFQIATRDRGFVYMSVRRTPYCNDERAVVEVDAQKFLELWRRNPREGASELGYRADRKYKNAEEGFSGGIENPVPLAHPYLCNGIEKTPIYSPFLLFFRRLRGYEESAFKYIDFSDGVTRTHWLLNNGATAFPVE